MSYNIKSIKYSYIVLSLTLVEHGTLPVGKIKINICYY